MVKLNEKTTTCFVKPIDAKNLKEAVQIAFSAQGYGFTLNSELIDVKNRFRIFRFGNKTYLVKTSSAKDGKEEVKFASKVKGKINKKQIHGRKLIVVVPKLIVIDNTSYIITEYHGNSLQEKLYSDDYPYSLTFEEFKAILNLFMSKNILYRGFLPRNVILTNEFIYLIDWEDVIFSKRAIENYLNLQYQTNLILNWGYFYNNQDIKRYFDVLNMNKYLIEPKLCKYEIMLDKLLFQADSIRQLRENVEKIVLESEKNINGQHVCILPHDMAHLISDMFNVYMDVLFDVFAYYYRKNNEFLYEIFLKDFSKFVVDNYENDKDFKYNCLLKLLNFFDILYVEKNNERIDNLSDLIQKDKEIFISRMQDNIKHCLLSFDFPLINNDDIVKQFAQSVFEIYEAEKPNVKL